VLLSSSLAVLMSFFSSYLFVQFMRLQRNLAKEKGGRKENDFPQNPPEEADCGKGLERAAAPPPPPPPPPAGPPKADKEPRELSPRADPKLYEELMRGIADATGAPSEAEGGLLFVQAAAPAAGGPLGDGFADALGELLCDKLGLVGVVPAACDEIHLSATPALTSWEGGEGE